MAIKVNKHQEGNNVLGYLTQVRWSFYEDLTTDYEIENYISVLFLSLKFHTAKPEYIITRMNQLREYKVQILLVLIDIRNYEEYLKEFVCFDHQVFYCFSNDEAAKYLHALDINSNRPTDLLKQKYSQNLQERKREFLSKFPQLNKNDCLYLSSDSLYSVLAEDKLNNYKKKQLSKLKKENIEEFLEMEF